MAPLTCLEICAGAGGMALGLEQAGFVHKAAVEFDPHACETLRLNRPWPVIEADVRTITGSAFQGVDLFCGGMPSLDRRANGRQDLFREALRLVREIAPRAVLLETVRELATSHSAGYRDQLISEFAELGYEVSWSVVHAANYGVPQPRPRCVLVAIMPPWSRYFHWPPPSMPPPTVGEVLYDLMGEHGWPGASSWRDQALRIAPTIVGGSARGGPDLGPTRAREAWRALGVDGLGISDEPPGPDFPVGQLPRLTVRMVARLQGFPDLWVFTGRKTIAYHQVSNAFPPPVARALGDAIRCALDTAIEGNDIGAVKTSSEHVAQVRRKMDSSINAAAQAERRQRHEDEVAAAIVDEGDIDAIKTGGEIGAPAGEVPPSFRPVSAGAATESTSSVQSGSTSHPGSSVRHAAPHSTPTTPSEVPGSASSAPAPDSAKQSPPTEASRDQSKVMTSHAETDQERIARNSPTNPAAIIEVAIRRGDAHGTLTVEVVSSVAGEASASVSLDVDGLLSRRERLQSAVLASSVVSRRILPETERPVREMGQLLFAAALGAGEVSGRYRASAALAADRGQRLRVVLRIDSPELAVLPWEAMYDEAVGEYVCRHDQLVRHAGIASVPSPLQVRPPLRILGITSSPRGLSPLDVEKEQEQLAQALARLVGFGLVELHWAPAATWTDLHAILFEGPWHVVHYIGHGDFDAVREEGFLSLVGEHGRADNVAAHRLVTLMRQANPMPRLVMLNSCLGAQASASDLFSGTAAALVRGGFSAAAAMQYEISDRAAVAFARGFYTAIAHGRGIDDAMSSGRVAILGTSGNTLEWITPVLYLRGRDAQLLTTA
jgi:site-specific DNA-cytosine methylase